MPSFMNENMIPTVFRWEHGGDEVFVTGTFTNWKDHIPMHRSGNDFTHIQMLPRGQHAYKFIVDGEWRWDPEQDTVADGAQNINNFIDLTDFTRDDEREEEYPASDDDEYGNAVPTDDQYTKEPPQLPPHLRQILLNMPQSSTPSIIPHLPEPTHVTLDHLYCTAIKDGLMVQGMTQRFRRKCTTTVFYSVLPTPSSAPTSGGQDLAAFVKKRQEEATEHVLQQMQQQLGVDPRTISPHDAKEMRQRAQQDAHEYLIRHDAQYMDAVRHLQQQSTTG